MTPLLDPTAVNDPLYPYQWHIFHAATQGTVLVPFNDASSPPNIASDIHQINTDTETGCGIKVAVVDTGMEIAHEDLSPNVVPGASSNFNTGGNDPTPSSSGGDHGTSVSGLIAARMGNGLGGRGVAGEASLVGYNFLSAVQSLAVRIPSLGGAAYSADVDVFNQSYGALASNLDPNIEAQLLSGVTNLRGGLGAIYVKSAGNGFGPIVTGLNCTLAAAVGVSCQDVNMDGENAAPYNIIVAAVNAGSGATAPTKSSYSTAGSAIWVSAPGGEFGVDNTVACGACTHPDIDAAMVTTDLTSCSRGYSVGGAFNSTTTINKFNWANGNTVQTTWNPNCNYVSTFNGTSSAAPVLSGAIAALLQANPNLTWRDVKYILAKTAVKVDAAIPTLPGVTCTNIGTGGLQTFFPVPAWVANRALFNFHNWYGFGRVDLDAAIALALTNPATWKPNGFGTPTPSALTTTLYATSSASFLIPDCDAAGTGTLSGTLTTVPAPVFIEAVQVDVCMTHGNVGEVQLVLKNVATSQTAVLLPGRNGFNGIPVTAGCQLFETNFFYGDTSAQGFQLIAYDTVANGAGGTITGWSVRVYGH